MRCTAPVVGVLALALFASVTRSFARPQATVIPGPAQVALAGNCAILGQIVDTDGNPVDGALVSLNGGLVQANGASGRAANLPGGPRFVLTNQNGQFAFLDLPAGSYSLDAGKSGYSNGAYGRRRIGGAAQSLTIAEGTPGAGVKITIFKFGAISGTILDEAGEPVVGVTVNVLQRTYDTGRPRFASSTTVQTDDRGFYRASRLTPGDYVVGVPSTQTTVPLDFLEAQSAAMSNGGSRAQFMNGVGLEISPSIAGTRIGDFVFAGRFGDQSRTSIAPPPGVDDALAIYPTTFYPGTTSLGDARVIQLSPGREVSGADVPINLLPGQRIVGRVVGPEGSVANLGLRLVAGYAVDLAVEAPMDVAITTTNGRGEFTFLGVPAGPYTIRALKMQVPTGGTSGGGQIPAHTYWANQPVMVDKSPMEPVTVTLATGFRVSGRFEFDGTSAKPAASVIQRMVAQIQSLEGHETDSRPLSMQPLPTGEFTTNEIPPGRYFIRMAAFDWAALGVWAYKASMLNGTDVGTVPIDLREDITGVRIVMSDHANEVMGVVRDAQGKPDVLAAVLIFPTDRDAWTNFGTYPRVLRNLQPNSEGVFRMPNLPAGEYNVIAVPDERTDDWMNPAFLERLTAQATRFRVTEGQKTNLAVTTTVIR